MFNAHSAPLPKTDGMTAGIMKVALAAAIGAVPAVLAAQAKPGPSSAQAPPEELKKIIQDCSAHKFEAVIETVVDGKPKKSRMKLCGLQGQSDSDWIRTLKDAVEKTAANDKMPPDVRAQIITAINREIVRLSAIAPASASVAATVPPPVSVPTPLPRPRSAAPTAPVARDYAALPPMPSAPTLAPPKLVSPSALQLPKPRLSLECFTPGEMAGEGPCFEFARGTYVSVRAGEDLPAGTALRFVRNGENRADVQLAQLRKGKTLRFELPAQVCQGAAGGRLKIEILRSVPNAGPQPVGSEGPYNLRC